MKNILTIIAIVFISNQILGQSINIDKKLGKEGFKRVVNTHGIYNDSSMTAYINKLGQRLVSQLDTALFDYHFYIENDEIPNAFALPGGSIFITTGLIPIIKNEDELAGIIGHEITHSNNRHTIRQIKKRILPSLAILPITIINDIAPMLQPFTMSVTSSEEMMLAGYSRKDETEADEQGAILAAKAGYNPIALTHALNRLMRSIEYLTGEKERQSYFADHPYTPDREKDIIRIAKNTQIQKTKKISDNYIQEFNGIIYGHNPIKGIINNNTLFQVKRNTHIEFPNYWSVENRDSIVISYSPHRDAVYVVKFDNSTLTAKENGKIFTETFPKKHKEKITKSTTTKINNKECYIVELEEKLNNTDTSFVKIIWMPLGKNLLRITTISDIKNNATINDVTSSIRQLNNNEKESILIKYISVVKANDNETLAELCKRTNNKVHTHVISIINDIPENEKLKKDKEIKIVLEKPYIQN